MRVGCALVPSTGKTGIREVQVPASLRSCEWSTHDAGLVWLGRSRNLAKGIGEVT